MLIYTYILSAVSVGVWIPSVTILLHRMWSSLQWGRHLNRTTPTKKRYFNICKPNYSRCFPFPRDHRSVWTWEVPPSQKSMWVRWCVYDIDYIPVYPLQIENTSKSDPWSYEAAKAVAKKAQKPALWDFLTYWYRSWRFCTFFWEHLRVRIATIWYEVACALHRDKNLYPKNPCPFRCEAKGVLYM